MEKEKKLLLADSNIIIDFWKKPDFQTRGIFENEQIAICGIIQAELIHGARSEKELSYIIKALDDLIFLEIDSEDWVEIGKYLNILKRNGVTIPFQDAIITYIAVKYDALLWTNDQHFKLIQTTIKELQLFKYEKTHVQD